MTHNADAQTQPKTLEQDRQRRALLINALGGAKPHDAPQSTAELLKKRRERRNNG
jgi:hypothetical protein